MIEVDTKRCEIYARLHNSNTLHNDNIQIINGDITKFETKMVAVRAINVHNIRVAIITAPCTSFSTIGRNKLQEDMIDDPVNYILFDCLQILKICISNIDYILIENVPRMLNVRFRFNGEVLCITDILCREFGEIYNIYIDVLDMSHYNVPSTRKRLIIRMSKKSLEWRLPHPKTPIKLSDTIGFLPAIEAGEQSEFPLHDAPKLHSNVCDAIRHTPTGCCAFDNKSQFLPRDKHGDVITNSFRSTFTRATWDKPGPTVTSGVRGSNAFHPGRQIKSDEWSDARNFSILELLLIQGILTPQEAQNPSDKIKYIVDVISHCSRTLIRSCIADAVSPRFIDTIFRYVNP